MIIRCTRCGDPAGVVMAFNYGDRRVWLDDLDNDADTIAGYALCDRHAGKLVPPVGWMLTDQRTVVRPLFVSREVA